MGDRSQGGEADDGGVLGMKVVLHRIERGEDGGIDLEVSFGDGLREWYSASYDGSDGGVKVCEVDESLFFALSDAGVKRFGDASVYQVEVMDLVRAFDRGEELPEMPVELGTTRFGRGFRPGRLRIVVNRLKRVLYRTGILRCKAWVHPECRRER